MTKGGTIGVTGEYEILSRYGYVSNPFIGLARNEDDIIKYK